MSNFRLSAYCIPGDHSTEENHEKENPNDDLHPKIVHNLRVAGQNMATSLVLLSSLILVVCITMCFTLYIFKNKINPI